MNLPQNLPEEPQKDPQNSGEGGAWTPGRLLRTSFFSFLKMAPFWKIPFELLPVSVLTPEQNIKHLQRV